MYAFIRHSFAEANSVFADVVITPLLVNFRYTPRKDGISIPWYSVSYSLLDS